MSGRSVQFGLNVDPNVGGLPIAERIAAIADVNGLELVGIQDHPYNARLYDTFTLITWLASKTSRVRFVPNVANLPLRPPAMLAKQTATMDAGTGGGFELGLGSGGFRDAAAGMALRRDARQRHAKLSAKRSTLSARSGRASRLRSIASITSCQPSNPDHRPPTRSASGSAS